MVRKGRHKVVLVPQEGIGEPYTGWSVTYIGFVGLIHGGLHPMPHGPPRRGLKEKEYTTLPCHASQRRSPQKESRPGIVIGGVRELDREKNLYRGRQPQSVQDVPKQWLECSPNRQQVTSECLVLNP